MKDKQLGARMVRYLLTVDFLPPSPGISSLSLDPCFNTDCKVFNLKQ